MEQSKQVMAKRLTASLQDLTMLSEIGRIDDATFEDQSLRITAMFILAISSKPVDRILEVLA